MIEAKLLKIAIQTIVERQMTIMGPLAVEQANKVQGLKVSDIGSVNVEIVGSNSAEILLTLVGKFEELFGKTSIEVCKDALKEVNVIAPKDLPTILR